MVKVSPWRRFWAQARSLLNAGRIEVVLSALMIVLVLVIETQRRAAFGVGLDVLAYCLTALSARWPKTGAVLVGLFLSVRLMLPTTAGSFSEYISLIVILGAGMRGDVMMRRVVTAVYMPLSFGILQVFAPNDSELLLGMFVWAILVAIAWMIGSVSHGYTTALRRAHAAEAQLQRQVLARELHDTVARSFTQVAMVAERARVRGGASEQDLDAISEAAVKGVDELRLMMGLLRDPSASVEALSGGTSLAEALSSAQAALRREGFNIAVSVEGDLTQLGEAESAMLAAVTAEAEANIARHGDPDEPVGVVVQVEDGRAELTFINSAADAAHSSAQPMGLWGMRQRVEGAGGSVEAGSEDQRWVVRVELPLAEKASTR